MSVARHVQRSAEDAGEGQHVVDLVGEVGAAGAHHGGAAGLGLVGHDLGHGVGHGKDDRLVGHGAHHRRAVSAARGRDADEDVGTLHGVGQAAVHACRGWSWRRSPALLGVQTLAVAVVDDARCGRRVITSPTPMRACSRRAMADARRAGAVDDDAQRRRCPCPVSLQALMQRGRRSRRPCRAGRRGTRGCRRSPCSRRSISKQRGARDVLQVDAAEGLPASSSTVRTISSTSLERMHSGNGIDVGERLEERALALHDRHAGLGADVAQAEHGACRR